MSQNETRLFSMLTQIVEAYAATLDAEYGTGKSESCVEIQKAKKLIQEFRIDSELDQQSREESEDHRTLTAGRQRIAYFLHSCSDSWGRQADQYEAYGDKEQAKACAQTATAFAAAARTIEQGNE